MIVKNGPRSRVSKRPGRTDAEVIMDLAVYDGKNVIIKDIYGETFSGVAEYGNHDFLECEYGGDEDGIFIEDVLLYNSQIETIEEM